MILPKLLRRRNLIHSIGKMKYINLIFILSFLSSALFAEDRKSKIDSLEKCIGNWHKQDTIKVNLLVDLANQLYEMDRYDDAFITAMQAKLLAEKLNFKSGIASSLRRIGAIQTEQGEYPQALESLLSSLHIYESLHNNQEIFMVNNNIGTVFYYQQDYEKALEYYGKSFKYNQVDGLTNTNIGMVYGEKGEYTYSLYYFFQALKYYKAENNNNGIGLALINIGTIYDLQNQNDSALVYYLKSLEIKREIKDYKGQCDALGSIGDIYFKQKQYTQALKHQNQSLQLSKQINYANGIKLTEEALTNLYTVLNNPIQAFEHYKNFISIRDSMFNEENTKRTVRAEMNFSFQKEQERIKLEQDKKDVIQNEILKRRQILILAFSSGFGLILLFSFFLFINYKKIRKAKNIIAIQNISLEHQQKEVTDSINYAQRIQQAMLPSYEYIDKMFPNSFILYKPKDIVSGDFYWAYDDGLRKYIAVADCTGHGVPGAMMSMIGASLLNEIVIERRIIQPDLILNALRYEIIKALNKQGANEELKDGMDISFIKITGNILECACANNPLYIVRNGNIIEIKPDKFPVGKYIGNSLFTCQQTELQKGDMIYLLSDGFCDQFGGAKGKKLMTKRFKEWILEMAINNVKHIREELADRFIRWKNTEEQVDDVTILGIKI